MSIQLFEFLQPSNFERRLFGRSDWGRATPSLKLEFKESATAYNLTMETPGIAKQDIKLNVENGVLTVTAECKQERSGEKDHVHFSERSYGVSSRSIRLPRNVAADRIAARHENGVLTVDIPKQDNDASSSIQIQ